MDKETYKITIELSEDKLYWLIYVTFEEKNSSVGGHFETKLEAYKRAVHYLTSYFKRDNEQ